MDPLAHTLVGATLAETRLRNGTAALAGPAGVLAANAPDIDAVTMFISRDLSLGFRRGWTHGVLAMVVLPLVLTAALLLLDRVVARWRGRAPTARAGPLLRLTSVAVLSHPALDWLNTYGVRFLMPFDDTWFYGDALFIIDPWLWLLGGLTVVLAHSASPAGAAGWGLLAAAAAVTGRAIGFGRFADTPPATALAWGAGLAAIVWMRVTDAGRGRRPQIAAACLAGNGNQKRDLCGHVKWDPQVLRQNIKFWALLATEKLTVTTDSGGLHFDLHSKVVQTAEEALGNAVLVAVRQVPAAEVVVVRLVAEHEVSSGQHGSGDRHDCLLRAAPALEPSKLRLQIAPVLPGCRPRGLDQRYSFSGSARAEISLKGQGFGAAPEVGSADALGS